MSRILPHETDQNDLDPGIKFQKCYKMESQNNDTNKIFLIITKQ